MADLSCKERLAEAKTALHSLRTGGQIVSVTYEGRTVQYSSTNMSSLCRYVEQLEAECGDCSAAGRRRPFGVTW